MSPATSAGGVVPVAVTPDATSAVAQLRSTAAIRERCGQLLARARAGGSGWFEVDDLALARTADAVAALTRQRFPGMQVPLHSRWRHFEAGGIDRKARLNQLLHHLPPTSWAHAMIDLTVVSVLLDAGAGPDWRYMEPGTGQTYTRSEGLAVASFHAFTAGLFSSKPQQPCQVDADGLRRLSTDRLAQAFQVNEGNPLVGLQGRTALLRQLGDSLSQQSEVFGNEGRPGVLFDLLVGPSGKGLPDSAEVDAHDLLVQLLSLLSDIWPADNQIGGVPLGDCWRHRAVRGEGASDGWVPFHKLSQWLTYSLLEPFQWAGVNVRNMASLTGLPEYRNGGLLLDAGVLRLKDAQTASHLWQPGDEIIVEWRALTVALLDALADPVRQRLNVSAEQLPLGAMLEGGTWAAGRALAEQRRGGLPPLQVISDGTVF